ncbi:MAG: ATP-binding cassette domain-containing protein [Proteobacteria bacterium]|nr:ATP-binding cassette domain-containing protein [Pseudomonadota bacterium]
MNKIIEIVNLYFRYKNIEILTDINFFVSKGEFVGIIGPNGAGKTTLLKLLVGLLSPSSGKITVFGREPQHPGMNKYLIGYVPQANEADKNFPISVREVVALGRYHEKGFFTNLNAEDFEIVETAIKKMNIESIADKQFNALSGGQKQRTLIARALAQRPKLLVLDEPTAGIDVKTQASFYEILKRLNQEGITIIMVSHDIGALTKEVSRIACLNRRLHMQGSPAEIMKSEQLKKLYGYDVLLLTHEGKEDVNES